MFSKDLLKRLDVLAAKATNPQDAEVLLEAATAIRTLQQGLTGWQLHSTMAQSKALSLADKLFVYQHSRRGELP
jgi:hypothetical protein